MENEQNNKTYAWCPFAMLPVKKSPDHQAELVTQLLFGDCVEVFERSGVWSRIKNLSDNYPGYVVNMQLEPITQSEAEHYEKHYALVNVFATHSERPLTLGSRIPTSLIKTVGDVVEINLPHDKTIHVDKKEIIFDNLPTNNVVDLAKKFLYTPYLWGGKTPFGLDCSGFTQLVFRMMGIVIARDAYQQAAQGTAVSGLMASKPGDLMFFHKPDGTRISHVGILIGNNQIIHSAGYVHIADVDSIGIRLKSGTHSHLISSIRRFF